MPLESDSDDEFFEILLPAILQSLLRKQKERKRCRDKVIADEQPKKRGGKAGRTWTQRTKGDIVYLFVLRLLFCVYVFVYLLLIGLLLQVKSNQKTFLGGV